MNGDAEAFGMLYARHRERMWAVALRTLGDPEEAADALQDAMISAFRQAAGFRGDAAVTTWLYRIVVNACLDRARRQAARPAISGLDEQAMDSLALRTRRSSEAVTTETVTAETSLEVTAALAALPAGQRAALVLVDMLGYSVADAAQILSTSVGTVKSRCARGRARLAPRLAHLRGQAKTQPTASSQVPPLRNQAAAGHVSPAEGGE